MSHRTIRLELQRRGGLTARSRWSSTACPQASASRVAVRRSRVSAVTWCSTSTHRRSRVTTTCGCMRGGPAPRLTRTSRCASTVRRRTSSAPGRASPSARAARSTASATVRIVLVGDRRRERRRGPSCSGSRRLLEAARRAPGHEARWPSAWTRAPAPGSGSVARDRAGNSAVTPVICHAPPGARLGQRPGPLARRLAAPRRAPSATGRSVRTARGAGAEATLHFTGAPWPSWRPGAPAGQLDVDIDGARSPRSTSRRPRTQPRRIVFASGAARRRRPRHHRHAPARRARSWTRSSSWSRTAAQRRRHAGRGVQEPLGRPPRTAPPGRPTTGRRCMPRRTMSAQRAPVLPRGDGARRRVVQQRPGRRRANRNPVPVVGVVVGIDHGVDETARGAHERHRAVAHRDELALAGRLEARGHQEHVRAGVDPPRLVPVEALEDARPGPVAPRPAPAGPPPGCGRRCPGRPVAPRRRSAPCAATRSRGRSPSGGRGGRRRPAPGPPGRGPAARTGRRGRRPCPSGPRRSSAPRSARVRGRVPERRGRCRS